MKKRNIFALLALTFTLIMLMQFGSAELFVSQQKGIYSKKDIMNLSVSINSLASMSDFLSLSLVCGESREIYKVPLTISANENKKIEIQIALEKSVIGSLEGRCFIDARYKEQRALSNSFEISSAININTNEFANTYNPGQIINISGNVIKRNSQSLDGSIEVSSIGLGINFVQPVKEGNFNFVFNIPEHAKAKNYALTLYAYDQDYEGNIANHGQANYSMIVRQVLSELDIALSSQSVIPGNNFSYSVVALDQAGENMFINANVKIYSPIGQVSELQTNSKETHFIEFPKNSTPGAWIIRASSENFNVSRTFVVEDYREIEYSLSGNLLYVRNIGNVFYSGQLKIKIANESVFKELELDVGEQKNFVLNAPDGEYEISVVGEEGDEALGKSFLTGNAISVEDAKGVFGSILPFAWVILIIILGIIILVYYKKIGKKDFISKTPSGSSGKVKSLAIDDIKQGKKEKASIVAIKIKNYSSIAGSRQFSETLSNIIEKAKSQKAEVSKTNDSLLLILPLVSQETILNAVDLARNCLLAFDKYNKKFSPKVEHGIGINEGELIIERTPQFRYMNTGNTLPLARRLADSAKNEILLSDSVHDATRSKVRAEKAIFGWKMTSLHDNSKYSDFIAKFKQRQAKG